MDRMACVELPAFPLQLLLKRYPGWADRPVAVVDRDKPQGVILWLNEHARTSRIRTGMRYSAGLSLARTLHASEVPPADIAQGVSTLVAQLHRFSPDVEPCRDEPGVFWLNASGLSQLYPSPRAWATDIQTALQEWGFQAAIAVGFTRFGSYAIAKTVRASEKKTVAIVSDLTRERAMAGQVHLDRLGIAPRLRDALHKLGVRSVRAFLELPTAGIRRRFGEEAYRLHRLASGDLWAPLQRQEVKDPLAQFLNLDDPETNVARLLFSIKRLLNQLLSRITARHEVLTELTLRLRLDRTRPHIEQIRPAAPTVDMGQLMNLVRLRLESLVLQSGVIEIQATAKAVRATAVQPGLFAEQPRRSLAAANRALARIRAEFGNDVVVRARLTEGHLPEAQFAWETIETVTRAAPRDVACRPMVRRIHTRPILLPPRPRHEPDGWLVQGGINGHVKDLVGPYLVSGGWWRSVVHREYYFAQMRAGELLWIFYDRPRRRWCWQGRVE